MAVKVGGTALVDVRVGVGPLVGGAFVLVGVKIITLVGMGTRVCVLVGLELDGLVLVWGGVTVCVLVGEGLGGTGVAKNAPGVRKTSIQAGLVRMDGSRGSKKPTGIWVRKSLSGLRFDPIFEFSLQLGAKRSPHPLERIMQKNPNSRMSNMIRMESRLSFSRSRVCMETSIYGKTHEHSRARIGFFIMTRALQPDASPMSIDDTT